MRTILAAGILLASGSAMALPAGSYQARGNSARAETGTWDWTCDENGIVCCDSGTSFSAEGYQSLFRSSDGRNFANYGYASGGTWEQCFNSVDWNWTYTYSYWAASAENAFRFSKLNSASVTLNDVTVWSYTYDSTTDTYNETSTEGVDLAFSWTGAGTTNKGFFNGVYRGTDYFSHEKGSGSSREATFTALWNGAAMDVGDYVSAWLSNYTQMNIVKWGTR